ALDTPMSPMFGGVGMHELVGPENPREQNCATTGDRSELVSS
ncbi:hypothetical protein MNBD_ACTINO02-2313, partial [hydrothermal vent metagenome]